MIKLKDNHSLLEKVVSKPQKGLAELQKYLRELLAAEEYDKIESIASYFIFRSAHPNQNPQFKLGIIEGLETVSYIMREKQSLSTYVPQIISPILAFFHDPTQKIRFVAISSVYNVFTSLGGDCLSIFTNTFKELICVIIDSSADVRQAASHLNYTMKTLLNDAILDHKVFDIRDFIMVINENFILNNPQIKQFLIDWINTLDEICEFEVSFFLPQFIRDLLYLLINDHKNVRIKSDECLKGFLQGFREIYRLNGDIRTKLTKEDAEKIIQILLQILKESFAVEVNLHALEWLDQFSQFLYQQINNQAKPFFMPLFSQKFQNILFIVLQMISNENEIVRQKALAINRKLLVVFSSQTSINPDAVLMLPYILRESKSIHKIEAVIKWIIFLIRESNQTILFEINTVVQRIIQKICDKNGKSIISLLQNSIFTEKYFDLLIQVLLAYIYESRYSQIDLIFRRIINLSNVRDNFLIICRKLHAFQKSVFKFHVLDYLVNILVTEESLKQMRRDLANQDGLFKQIFTVFCSNEASLIVLGFLAKKYDLVYHLYHEFSEQSAVQLQKISSFLKIVNLLESPNMNFIKLDLLKTNRESYSLKRAYLGLILTLPSGKLNRLLMKRLELLNLPQTTVYYGQEEDIYPQVRETQELLSIYQESRKTYKIRK